MTSLSRPANNECEEAQRLVLASAAAGPADAQTPRIHADWVSRDVCPRDLEGAPCEEPGRAATQIRGRGYAVDEGEYRPETLGIAAPVFVRDQVPAALALSRPRDCVAYLVDGLIERVVTAAAALAGALKQPERGTDDRSA